MSGGEKCSDESVARDMLGMPGKPLQGLGQKKHLLKEGDTQARRCMKRSQLCECMGEIVQVLETAHTRTLG